MPRPQVPACFGFTIVKDLETVYKGWLLINVTIKTVFLKFLYEDRIKK